MKLNLTQKEKMLLLELILKGMKRPPKIFLVKEQL